MERSVFWVQTLLQDERECQWKLQVWTESRFDNVEPSRFRESFCNESDVEKWSHLEYIC